jgi:hypothetical protein
MGVIGSVNLTAIERGKLTRREKKGGWITPKLFGANSPPAINRTKDSTVKIELVVAPLGVLASF